MVNNGKFGKRLKITEEIDMNIKNKIAVVTGAGSGIGKATSLALAEKGAKLVLLGRREKRLHETKNEIEAKGGKAFVVKCDVSKKQSVAKAAGKILKKFKKVDVLINNAGFGIYKPVEEMSIEEFESTMQTNFFGTVYCTKAFLKGMIKNRKGCIVNVSSMAGKIAFPSLPAYCASKFAVSGFTEAICAGLKHYGIETVLVCPAGTRTDFFNHPSFEGHRHRKYPEKMMPPEKVAKAIVDAIENGSEEVILPFKEKIVLLGKNLAPKKFSKLQAERHKERMEKKEK